MRKIAFHFFSLLLAWSCSSPKQDEKSLEGDVSYWITSGDRTSLFAEVPTKLSFGSKTKVNNVIEVDTTQQFQTVDGFGYALTGGSAYLINQKLTDNTREELLKELFLVDGKRIGISYLRISIGASDLDDHVFSYDDFPVGKTDVSLSHFSLAEDQKNLIPLLKQIVKLNPEIKIMGSPWSAPAWMKDNNSPKGGSLKIEYYEVYAKYFVKYIQGMEAEGISIDAITLQNEPENPKNNPSMLMTAEEQALFVKQYLGPAFQDAAIKTKIVVFDHNCDHPNYPITVLNDGDAKKFINGSAFHLYLGDISALSEVQQAHPDRNIYFTEQWTWSKGNFDGDLRWHTKNLVIGAMRNWSRNVLEWNLAADPKQNPHTDEGGCTECLGALTISDSVSRNVSYYIIAHASKFVRPGSVRVASNLLDQLPNVAFINPNGQKVLIVLNDSDQVKEFAIKFNGKTTVTSLSKGAVGTYVW
jgi:glucosylceramidase